MRLVFIMLIVGILCAKFEGFLVCACLEMLTDTFLGCIIIVPCVRSL